MTTIQEINIVQAVAHLRPGVSFHFTGQDAFGNDLSSIKELEDMPTEAELIAAWEEIKPKPDPIKTSFNAMLLDAAGMIESLPYFHQLRLTLMNCVRQRLPLEERFLAIKNSIESNSFWTNVFSYLVEVNTGYSEFTSDEAKRAYCREAERFGIIGATESTIATLFFKEVVK